MLHKRYVSGISVETKETSNIIDYDEIPSVKNFDLRMEMLKEELAASYPNVGESVAYTERGIYNIPHEEVDEYVKRKMYGEDEVGL